MLPLEPFTFATCCVPVDPVLGDGPVLINETLVDPFATAAATEWWGCNVCTAWPWGGGGGGGAWDGCNWCGWPEVPVKVLGDEDDDDDDVLQGEDADDGDDDDAVTTASAVGDVLLFIDWWCCCCCWADEWCPWWNGWAWGWGWGWGALDATFCITAAAAATACKYEAGA